MSFFPGKDPAAGDKFQCDAIKALIVPRTADLGDGFTVRRALPSAQSRMVGPFVFFDHFGPTVFRAGNGMDVRPHPHIGLATVTYLFDGEIMHRDSLGTSAPIRPGEINWMTAGRGIVHSERTAPERRAGEDHLHGLQTWVALPSAAEEMAPAFAHHGVDDFPMVRDNGQTVRLMVGGAYGQRSPVKTTSDTLFADAHLKAGSTLPLDTDHEALQRLLPRTPLPNWKSMVRQAITPWPRRKQSALRASRRMPIRWYLARCPRSPFKGEGEMEMSIFSLL